MARGTANNEPVVSQAQTRAWDDGFDRTFGEDRGERGRFIWDPGAKRLVSASEYRADRALDAPIMVDRFYEGAKTQTVDENGKSRTVDIGSRRKHREFMKANGLTTADDFKGQWAKDAERRESMQRGEWKDPNRREALERAFWKINGKP